jgi:hypothetical protein
MCWCATPRLEIFEGHLLDGAPNALARIVNKDIDRSEVGFDGCEGPLHGGGVANIASIGARHGEFIRQSAREGGCAGQQRDGISLRRKPAGERGAITGPTPTTTQTGVWEGLADMGGTFVQA